MPKKMARLDESTDYRPFKFRIQAFTNAFHEEVSLSEHGLRPLAKRSSCSIVGLPKIPCRRRRLRTTYGGRT